MELNTSQQQRASIKPWTRKVNTKYGSFDQHVYTAGDEDQFISVVGTYSAEVIHTFRYIFNKFKKGVFVRITDNRVSIFLPFSKHGFTNNWSDRIVVPKNIFAIMNARENAANKKKYVFRPSSINTHIDQWYANNCLIRNEYPIAEKETNVCIIKHMLDTVCASRKIDDCDFFINRRDFPILSKPNDMGVRSEPYFHIFGNDVPIHTEPFAPIFSMCSADIYDDIIMPTHEDWTRVCSDILFPPSYRDYNYVFDTDWNDRKSIAVWRGTSTGCGVSADTYPINQRILLCKVAEKINEHELLCDVGLTRWSMRPRKLINNKCLQIQNPDLPISNHMTPVEQATYKYLVHVDGHVSAYRLSLELNMGCCILKVASDICNQRPNTGWKMWYELVPYVHFVPVKSDMSDLADIIRWCRSHDDECQQIAANARAFYQTHLGKEHILDHMQTLLQSLNKPITMENALLQKYALFKMPPRMLETNLMIEYPGDNMGNIHKLPKVYSVVSFENSPTMLAPRYIFNVSECFSCYFEKVFSLQKYTKRYYVGDIIIADTERIVSLNYLQRTYPFVAKYTADHARIVRYINEIYIARICVNDMCQVIPNFAYCLGANYSYQTTNKIMVCSEYISGNTLEANIRSQFGGAKNPFKKYLEILIQCMLAIEYAQQHYTFIHNALEPHHVIVQPTNTPTTIEYVLDVNTKYSIVTKHIAVMIDYGKSMLADGQPTTTPGMRYMKDMFQFVISSCALLAKEKLVENEDLFFLLSFFTAKPITNIKTAVEFINKWSTNISNTYKLVHLDQRDIGTDIKRPIDFLMYLASMFAKHKIGFGQKPSRNNIIMDSSLTRKVWNSIFGIPNDTLVTRIYASTLPQSNNMVDTYLAAQKLYTYVYKCEDKKAIEFIYNLYAYKLQCVDASCKMIPYEVINWKSPDKRGMIFELPKQYIEHCNPMLKMYTADVFQYDVKIRQEPPVIPFADIRYVSAAVFPTSNPASILKDPVLGYNMFVACHVLSALRVGLEDVFSAEEVDQIWVSLSVFAKHAPSTIFDKLIDRFFEGELVDIPNSLSALNAMVSNKYTDRDPLYLLNAETHAHFTIGIDK